MLKLNKNSIKDLFPHNEDRSFSIESKIKPAGDQISAIADLCKGINSKRY